MKPLGESFVKGHDFSHADKVKQINWALAPGSSPFTSSELCVSKKKGSVHNIWTEPFCVLLRLKDESGLELELAWAVEHIVGARGRAKG